MAAIYPIHYPRELFRAFDVHPVEVWGPPGVDTKMGSAHLQSYICSVVQSGLSFYLEGGLKEVKLILVPHCCDSLQGLGSIFKDFVKPGQEVLTLYIPRGITEESVRFLSDEIEKLYKSLARVTGRAPARERLMEEILLEEETDALVKDFYAGRKKTPLSSREFYAIIRAREYLPPRDYARLLQIAPRQSPESGPPGRVGIIVSGLLPEPMEILDVIDEAGGFVVADDLACCMRRVYGKGAAENPFKRMAERIVQGPPDSTKGGSVDEISVSLTGLTEATGARGVIFYNVKFCEPEDFYRPMLKKRLQNKGIKTLTLEADINQPLSQQAITRVRAFIEMLKGEA